MDKRNLKYYLRWSNGFQEEGQPYIPYQFYLENLETKEIIEINNEEAINFIKNKTTNGFRDDNQVDNHIELFNILNIKDGIKKKEVKDDIFHQRINKELHIRFKEQAKKENRTEANLFETILKDYLNRNKRK